MIPHKKNGIDPLPAVLDLIEGGAGPFRNGLRAHPTIERLASPRERPVNTTNPSPASILPAKVLSLACMHIYVVANLAALRKILLAVTFPAGGTIAADQA